MSLTNREIDRHYGINSVKDVVKKYEPMTDEKVIRAPDYWRVGAKAHPRDLGYHECIICVGGSIPYDMRRGLQFRQCNQCQNVFKIRKTGMGNFEFRYAPEVRPTPRRSL